MSEWPLFRSSITQGENAKPSLTIRSSADINIALSTPTGLYTPVIRGIDSLSAYDVASQLRHIAHLGRQVPNALPPVKRSGTISFSNVGAVGQGEYAMPVLVPGGGIAIVAVGRAKWIWDVEKEEKGERRLKIGVSWAADHRVVEGAELAAFVESWRSWVENPERMIAAAT